MLTGEIKKIGIFRVLQLGDLLCTIPAIKALHAKYPEATITLIGLPWAQLLVKRFNSYFNDFLHFPGYPGLPEQKFDPLETVSFLTDVQNRKFDLVLQMQGNGTLVNPLVELFGARHTAGFKIEGHYAPDNGLFLAYPDHGSEIHRHMALMEHLDIPGQGDHLEFPLTDSDSEELISAGLQFTSGTYVCVHPGSRGSWRQWPTSYFAAVADYCAEQGYTVVLTGTPDELPIVNEVRSYMKHQPVIAAGKTSLGAVGVLISNSALLVSNCTGVSHIASALETPSIVLSMDGEPERWGPLNSKIHYTFNWLKNPDFDAVFSQLIAMLPSLTEASPQQR